MIFIKLSNCLFYGIKQNLNSDLNTDLSEAEIFLCFGGYIFSVSKTEEVFYEGISITGTWVDFDYFSDFTKIKFNLINFKNSSTAIKYIINKVTSNNIQLAVVNSYYLPFDSVNYKKNYGKHLILIEKYDEYENCFYVTDERYKQEMIDLNDFTIASTNNFHTDIHLLNMLYTEMFDVTKIRENIPLILMNNAKKNYENSKYEFRKLNESLEKMNMLDSFKRSFSYYELVRAIKSRNGPIISKHYLINSSYIKDSFLINLIKESILKWERLCMDLYKAHLNDEILNFKEKIDFIEEVENKINEKMLKIL